MDTEKPLQESYPDTICGLRTVLPEPLTVRINQPAKLHGLKLIIRDGMVCGVGPSDEVKSLFPGTDWDKFGVATIDARASPPDLKIIK